MRFIHAHGIEKKVNSESQQLATQVFIMSEKIAKIVT